VWPEVTLRQGINVVTVTGAKNGKTYADHVLWTVVG
jgi:hypothetical protein